MNTFFPPKDYHFVKTFAEFTSNEQHQNKEVYGATVEWLRWLFADFLPWMVKYMCGLC
jgi:hypothetical protein